MICIHICIWFFLINFGWVSHLCIVYAVASEHLSELIGCPIFWSSPLWCVCLELWPLLQPAFPVSSVLRVSPPPQGDRPNPQECPVGYSCITPRGFLCCARFPCVHTVATILAQQLGHFIAQKTPSCIRLPRYGLRVGLCNVLFENCSAFTLITVCTLAPPTYFMACFTGGFNRFAVSTVYTYMLT
jgi:hypothetical protein